MRNLLIKKIEQVMGEENFLVMRLTIGMSLMVFGFLFFSVFFLRISRSFSFLFLLLIPIGFYTYHQGRKSIPYVHFKEDYF